jgi:hypothetical protein
MGRLYATWPKLLDLVDEGGKAWKWTQQEWAAWEKASESNPTPIHPFTNNLEDIVSSSPKASYVRKYIESEWAKKDAEGQIPRMVICSEFYTTTKLIYMVSTLSQHPET